MSTLVHAQYNSPMNLYSPEAVQEELERATGQHSPIPASGTGGKINLEQSGAYKAVHHNSRLAPQHSARYDEPRNQEYPQYKGYVDPNLQSPSFKRLQHYAGLDQSADDSQQAEAQQQEIVQGKPFPSSSSPHPQWYPDNPPVAQRDPASADERDHPLDPDFAQKIAEAERPKVPANVVPSWARKAHDKQQKWESQVESAEQRYYGAVPVPAPDSRPIAMPPPHSSSPKPPVASDSFRPMQYKTVVQSGAYDDKWQHHYDQYNLESGQPKRSPLPRPRSVEPEGYRTRQEKEPWLRPYIAPNVLNTKFTSSDQRYRSLQRQGAPFGQNMQANFGGMYYGPETLSKTTTSTFSRQKAYTDFPEQPGGFERPRTPTGGTYGSQEYGRREVNIPIQSSINANPWGQKSDERRHMQSRYERTTTHQDTSAPFSQTSRPPAVPHKPAWSSSIPPESGAPSSAPLWRNESEAWRRKTEMEQEIQRRATSTAPAPAPATQWRQELPIKSDAPAAQKWQDASGASTKSQTQGSYVDPQGNQVNYVKEVYTSSDPGAQYSMLTQEEKKALEEPLEPGVVSRHVTSKYYKRSTYTSQTTTSATPTAPAVSYPSHFESRQQQPLGPSYQVGQLGPGISQF